MGNFWILIEVDRYGFICCIASIESKVCHPTWQRSTDNYHKTILVMKVVHFILLFRRSESSGVDTSRSSEAWFHSRVSTSACCAGAELPSESYPRKCPTWGSYSPTQWQLMEMDSFSVQSVQSHCHNAQLRFWSCRRPPSTWKSMDNGTRGRLEEIRGWREGKRIRF